MIHVFIVNPMAGNMNFSEMLRKEISNYTDIDDKIINKAKKENVDEMITILEACIQ